MIESSKKNLCMFALIRHANSDIHKDSALLESNLKMSLKDGGIQQSFQNGVTAQQEAFVGALKCLYWLCKEQIVYTTKYEWLIDLAKFLGCTYLDNLFVGENAKYTSETFLQEVLASLAFVVRDNIHSAVKTSPVCSVLIDETMDIAVTSQLIIYFCYLSEGKLVTSFAGIVDIQNGKADTIYKKTIEFFNEIGLKWKEKLRGFGSEGASVMIGKEKGVASLFKKEISSLVPVHYICHLLALCGKDASESHHYIQEFFSIIDQVNRFYKNSAVRTAGLKTIQEALETTVKLSKAIDMQWLSKGRAVVNLKKALPAVLTSLSQEASEHKNADAHGLHDFISREKFIRTLYFMCDIMPELNKLSKNFQGDNFEYTRAKFHIENTKLFLKRLLHDCKQASKLESFKNDLDTVLKDYITTERGRAASSFDFYSDLYEPYLQMLIDCIDERFPISNIVEVIELFDPVHFESMEGLESGKMSLFELCSQLQNDPSLSFDLTTAESEWAVLFNELNTEYAGKQRASQKCSEVMMEVMNDEHMFPTLSKITNFGLILPMRQPVSMVSAS